MTLTIDISPDEQVLLSAKARAEGLSVEQWVRKQTLGATTTPVSMAEKISAKPADDRPIWEVIVDQMKDIPPEDMAALPRDGASQIDHYIYGLPKRD